MKNNNFLTLLIFSSLTNLTSSISNHTRTCFAKINRAVPSTVQNETIAYSFTELPLGEAPTADTKISVFQSNGLKMFNCNLESTTLATTSSSISVIMQSHFGARYSSSPKYQFIVGVLCKLAIGQIQTSWTTRLSSLGVGQTSSNISYTTSGISAHLVFPTANQNAAIDGLSAFVNLVLGITLTDAIIDTAFQDTGTSMNNLKKMPNGTTIAQNHQYAFYANDAKIDCSREGCSNRLMDCFIAIGGDQEYSKSLHSTLSGSTEGRALVKQGLNLMKQYKSYLLFSASSSSTFNSSIIALATRFSTSTSPKHVKQFQKPFFGYCERRNQSTSTQNTLTGKAMNGTIWLGPVSVTSILAMLIISYFLKASPGSITLSTYINGYVSSVPLIIAGQTVLKLETSSFAGTYSEALDGTLGLFASRYSSGGNTGDFSSNAFYNMITNGSKATSVGSNWQAFALTSHNPTFWGNSNTDVYVWWMQVYLGAFKINSELRSLSTDSNTNKTAALRTAAGLLQQKCKIEEALEELYTN